MTDSERDSECGRCNTSGLVAGAILVTTAHVKALTVTIECGMSDAIVELATQC